MKIAYRGSTRKTRTAPELVNGIFHGAPFSNKRDRCYTRYNIGILGESHFRWFLPFFFYFQEGNRINAL